MYFSCRLQTCVAQVGVVRFSVHGFGCALFCFGIDKEGYSYCDVDFIRYKNSRDEACKDYKCKEFINI